MFWFLEWLIKFLYGEDTADELNRRNNPRRRRRR
jgi:hypothetical protein